MNKKQFIKSLEKQNLSENEVLYQWYVYQTRQKYLKYISENGLTSYMNNTKWNELINALNNEISFSPPYEVQFLFDSQDYSTGFYKAIEEKSLQYAECYDNETFNNQEYFLIEWLKIHPKYYERIGGQLYYKIVEHSCESELIEILKKYNIPYEYKNEVYTIYGYKGNSYE